MHPLGLLHVCNTHGLLWFCSEILWHMSMEDVLQWEWDRLSRHNLWKQIQD